MSSTNSTQDLIAGQAHLDYATHTSRERPAEPQMRQMGVPQTQARHNQHELQGVRNGKGSTPAADHSMAHFLREVSLIQNAYSAYKSVDGVILCVQKIDITAAALQDLRTAIDQISNLHMRVLNTGADEARQESAKAELQHTTEYTALITNDIKLGIQKLARWPPTAGGEGEKEIRALQVKAQKAKYVILCHPLSNRTATKYDSVGL